MPSEWHRLNSPQESLPPLLFQYTWSRQGYELYVTDLTFIWSERLPHREIVKRAEENTTTIDPSEDVEQLDVLLTKIGEALRGDGGSSTLNSGSHADTLELTTSTKLPAPLRPLSWSLYLLREPSSSLTEKILLPLLRDEAGWESRQRHLLDQLKQKDWILGKLLDKVETLGVDLGTVFPGAAGLRTSRKGSTRSEAAKIIKGLAPFDGSAWLAESTESRSGISGLAANISQEILGSERIRDLDRLRASHDKWWTTLPSRSEMIFAQERQSIEPSKKGISPARSEGLKQPPQPDTDQETASTASEDEFQQDSRLSISPPKAQKKAGKKTPPPKIAETAADDVTASESELDLESEAPPEHAGTASARSKPAPPQPEPQGPPKKRKGGLGVIGGKKKEEKGEQLPPSSPPSGQQTKAPGLASSTPAAPAKRPTKLGTIGGKPKSKTADTQPSKQPVPAASSEPIPTPQTPGADGHVSESTTGKDAQKGKTSAPSRTIPEPTVIPETEDEKANRKREELKRELEAKSKAPAKKKRRF
ncbi:XLF/Cernunnos protein [Penicillium hispanicum]|uniref:XLF/Cernunnos protein n=1 Tax=Penicillium hispanicum TaxID=1080232 RepID=UPI00253F6933|nr:XLF/Cernunnos protein [Penicillium hispanicum]KAJ5574336.1 XLF/Cernunnos protein [Penicillium hispanicum]